MTGGSWMIGGLSPAAVESFAALTLALARLADQGCTTPCQGPYADLWTSEDHAEREAAGYRCAGCPVLDLCAEHGQHERQAVWAGRDRTPRPRKARNRKEAE